MLRENKPNIASKLVLNIGQNLFLQTCRKLYNSLNICSRCSLKSALNQVLIRSGM